jgi:mono/diheme cytochrome c family protein
MFVNLVVLLLILALVFGFGWLTRRAWKAGRGFVKWPGAVLGGMLTLLCAAVAFFAGKGLAFAYVPPAPAPDLQVEGTPEQVARGEYLVNVACRGCHSADTSGAFLLTGGVDFAGEIPLPIGHFVAANLTPGGILAERTDGELFRAIRHGYGKRERAGFMSFMPYRQLSDEDTKAIIAFLRAQPPATTPTNGGDQINVLGAILLYGLGVYPFPETTDGVITAPPRGETPEYGKYVATFGECRGCHGPDMTGMAATAVSEAVVNPRPTVALWTPEAFIQTMRTGIRPNGVPLQMPWRNAAAMSDEDLRALYAYLRVAP